MLQEIQLQTKKEVQMERTRYGTWIGRRIIVRLPSWNGTLNGATWGGTRDRTWFKTGQQVRNRTRYITWKIRRQMSWTFTWISRRITARLPSWNSTRNETWFPTGQQDWDGAGCIAWRIRRQTSWTFTWIISQTSGRGCGWRFCCW